MIVIFTEDTDVAVSCLGRGPQIKKNEVKTRKVRKLNMQGKLSSQCDLNYYT